MLFKNNILKALEATFFALVWGGSSIMKNHSFNWLTFKIILISRIALA
jgi:hypothetical protein